MKKTHEKTKKNNEKRRKHIRENSMDFWEKIKNHKKIQIIWTSGENSKIENYENRKFRETQTKMVWRRNAGGAYDRTQGRQTRAGAFAAAGACAHAVAGSLRPVRHASGHEKTEAGHQDRDDRGDARGAGAEGDRFPQRTHGQGADV